MILFKYVLSPKTCTEVSKLKVLQFCTLTGKIHEIFFIEVMFSGKKFPLVESLKKPLHKHSAFHSNTKQIREKFNF